MSTGDHRSGPVPMARIAHMGWSLPLLDGAPKWNRTGGSSVMRWRIDQSQTLGQKPVQRVNVQLDVSLPDGCICRILANNVQATKPRAGKVIMTFKREPSTAFRVRERPLRFNST